MLRLFLNFSVRAVQSGPSRWNVSLSVNTTLTIQFHTSSTPERVLVRHNTEIAKRFLVDLHGHTIKIEKIQLSDQGQYQVVAYVGKIRAKARIRIIVQEEFVPSTSTPTTTSSTRIPGSVSLIVKSPRATKHPNYNVTVPASSIQSESSHSMEHKAGKRYTVCIYILLT